MTLLTFGLTPVLAGHTICGRFAEFGYLSDAAEQAFPNMKKRNAFFAAVGMLPPLTTRVADALRLAGPGTAFKKINDAVRAGAWSV